MKWRVDVDDEQVMKGSKVADVSKKSWLLEEGWRGWRRKKKKKNEEEEEYL